MCRDKAQFGNGHNIVIGWDRWQKFPPNVSTDVLNFDVMGPSVLTCINLNPGMDK